MTPMIDWLKISGTTLGTSLLMAVPALAQQGPGPGPGQGGPGPRQWFGGGPQMMGWHHHAHGGMLLHGFFALLALIGLVCVVLAIIRAFRGRCGHRRRGSGVGLEILETRYAKGEIGRDEYIEKKRDLGGRA